MSELNDVVKESDLIKTWKNDSLLPRTLLQGTKGMRGAGQEFLPKQPIETEAFYKNRLKTSTLLNAYKKTTSFLAGQVFQSDIIFDESVIPSNIQDLFPSIDIKENDVNVFAKRLFFNGVGKGVSHILVDMPVVDPDQIKTRADEKSAGIRPYFQEIKPENILGGLIDSSGFLVQVRILEVTPEITGKFTSKLVTRVRVLEPGRWELYRVVSKNKVILEDEGDFSIDYIPFVSFIPGEETSVLTGTTPLMDLADLNAKHWRSASHQDSILNVARVPILFGNHLDLDTMPVQMSSLLNSDADGADLKYVEHSGAAIAAGREDLQDTEAVMALYGLQQLIPRSGGSMTATEKMLTSNESNSSLSTWSTEFQGVLLKAFQIMADFMGESVTLDQGSIQVNKEYNYGIANPEELAQLISLYENGVLSAQNTFREFKRRGTLDETTLWEDNKDQLELDKMSNPDLSGLSGSIFGQV